MRCWWEPIHYITGGKWIAYPHWMVVIRRGAFRAMRLVCVAGALPLAIAPFVPAYAPPLPAAWVDQSPWDVPDFNSWGTGGDNTGAMPGFLPVWPGMGWGSVSSGGFGAYGPVASNFGGVGYEQYREGNFGNPVCCRDLPAGGGVHHGGVVDVETTPPVPVTESGALSVFFIGVLAMWRVRR